MSTNPPPEPPAGWLEPGFDNVVDGLLSRQGIHGAQRIAEARSARMAELGLDAFARAWRRIAEELSLRITRGPDA